MLNSIEISGLKTINYNCTIQNSKNCNKNIITWYNDHTFTINHIELELFNILFLIFQKPLQDTRKSS